MGEGFGTKAADVFLNIWKSDINYENADTETLGTSTRTSIAGKVAERYLVPKLAEIYTDNNGIKKVRAIKNFRNKSVRFIVYTIKNLVPRI